MSSIDQRVVQMVFDNDAFERGVAATLATVEKLNKGLQLEGATKGLSDVSAAAKNMTVEPIAAGLDKVANKFSVMSIAGVTALATITSKAVDAGIKITKSLTIDPIKAGFGNYETQINAVQTILANTSSQGTKLGAVNDALSQLNTYANQTVYNFSEMTRNIGTFTAAGVNLKTSVDSIKGIANLAAISGSSSEQASTAMYQLSQAIAAGKVSLQDWNSVVNAGLGGKTFQDALVNTARASGVAIDSIIKKQGGFRASLEKGWLTSDILTKTLSQFTGDLSLAQIKAMGYTDAQAKSIFELGQTAIGAATKIKTATQLGDALKEEVASAYGSVFKTIFGDINQATVLFSGIHDVAEKALTGPIYALNTLLEGWTKLGGRAVAITAIKEAFSALAAVIKPIEAAFREIFPKTTAKQLYEMTLAFKAFTDRLKIGANAADEIKRTFAGLFAIFSIVWEFTKALVKTFFQLFGTMTEGSGSILKFTAHIGDFLVNLNASIKRGDEFTKFFGKLEKVLEAPIYFLRLVGDYIKLIFDKVRGDDLAAAFDKIHIKLGPIGALAKLAGEGIAWLYNHLGAFGDFLQPFLQKFGKFASDLGHSLVEGFSNLNFDQVVALINTAFFGGILLLVKKFVSKFKGGGGELGSFVSTIKETFESLTKTLDAMQTTLKAAALLEIALAIGILTISVIALAKIDAAGLVKATGALTVMFTQLLVSLGIFQKFIGTEGFAKLPFMMLSLILLAAAVDILVIAVKKLSALSWQELRKGLLGLAVVLGSLAASVKLMGNPERMITVGLGLIALAKGVRILVGSVVTLSGLSWTEIAKGLIGVGGLLVSLALFSKFAEANAAGAAQGAGIILLAVGIKILADAMEKFGKFSWTEMAKGLVGVGGGLTAIAGALVLLPPSSLFSAAGILIVASSLGLIADAVAKMGGQDKVVIAKGIIEMAGALTLISAALILLPPSTLISAAGIFIVAASLGMIGDALAKMGKQSWTQIAKGLVELGGALVIIGGVLLFMVDAIPGAFALLVIAGALAILTPVLEAFGKLSWTEMAKSLLELVGVFVVLGASALILAPLAPVILALSTAILILGAGMVLAGVGVLLFSIGLSALAVAGAAGTIAIVGIVTALLGLLPLVAKEIGLAIIAFAEVIATAGPAITKAVVTVIGSLLDAIVQLTPKFIDAVLKLLTTLLQKLLEYAPKLIDAGVKLILAFLDGIARNIGKVISSAVDIMVAFVKGISDNLPKIIQSAFDLVINFLNSLSDAIDKNAKAVGEAAGKLAVSIVNGIINGLKAAVGKVGEAAVNLAKSALHSAEDFLGISSPSKEFHKVGVFSGEGLINGLDSMGESVSQSGKAIGEKALASLSKSIVGINNLVFESIDMNPRITPVLDLASVKKSAGEIGTMLNTNPISVTSAYSQAKNVSAGYTENQFATKQTTTLPQQPAAPVFNQYNNSPKALSAAEIYRQTNNQISKARGVLVYQSGGTQQ